MSEVNIFNIPKPFSIDYCNSYKSISKWKIDKSILEKETNIVKKIELYNYFKKSEVENLIKHLNSKAFKYTKKANEYPRIFNVILNQENKFITWRWKILDIKEKMPKYYYYVLFSKVLVHRNRAYLIKIYHNIAQNKDFVKLEITYSYFKPKGKYNIHFLDWLNSLKGMNEVISKLEKKVSFIGFYEDFSEQVYFESFILQIIWKYGRSGVNHVYNIFAKLTGDKSYTDIYQKSLLANKERWK